MNIFEIVLKRRDRLLLKLSCANKTQRQMIRKGIFLFPVLLVLGIIVFKSYSPDWYRKLMWEEDSPLEYSTAVFYFLACPISFYISKSFYERKSFLFSGLYFLLSFGFFLVGMDEISWGQRIFHINTPRFFRPYNWQQEITWHNLKGFPLHLSYIVVGLYGAFSRFLLPKRIKSNYKSLVNLFVPDYFLFFYFFIVAGLYLYYEYFSSILVSLFGEQFGWRNGQFMHSKDQEPAEFLLSAGFLLFVTINRYRQVVTNTLGGKTLNSKAPGLPP
jgi:hypothetical protein